MSHVTTCAVAIKNLDALRDAAKEFGGILVIKDHYNWYGRLVGDYPMPKGITNGQLGACDYVVQVNGINYEIGVVRQKDGTYTLAYDFYGSAGSRHDGHKLKEKFGEGLKKLAQAYTKHNTIATFRRRGWMVREAGATAGKIRMEAYRL